jgi:glycosyltransferase involved in cell wall biosynthesis
MGKMKVGILCSLASFKENYSVASVVKNHLKLLSSKVDTVFITTDDFYDFENLPKNIELRTFPRWKCESNDFDKIRDYVKETNKDLKKCLKDISVCFIHDLLFVSGFEPANLLLKEIIPTFQTVKWYSICHSGPSKRPITVSEEDCCYIPAPNVTYVSLNFTDVRRFSEMYEIPLGSIKVMHNFIDPETTYKWHPLTSEIYNNYKLWQVDYLCVYPTRITQSKGIEKAAKLVSALKSLGKKVCLIVANTWSNNPIEKALINEIKSEVDLNSNELLFTSELVESNWVTNNKHPIELGLPYEVVQDLIRYSDLFILPSMSEACSLSMLEAAMGKTTCVLNEDVWSLQEFGGQPMTNHSSNRVIYFQFGSTTRSIVSYHPSEKEWYLDHAKILDSEQSTDKSIQFFKYVRKYHSPMYVYENFLSPMIHQR